MRYVLKKVLCFLLCLGIGIVGKTDKIVIAASADIEFFTEDAAIEAEREFTLILEISSDMTIGDFVFEFDSTFVDYTDQEIMDIYDQALSGFDIVILMKEHAFYYTYDRMKFIFILSFLICELSHCLLSNAKEKRYEQVLLFLVTILVCGLNFDTYKKNESYIWETDYRNDNLILAEYISENYSDSILATESRGAVRGYINTLFDRGIYEGTGQYESQPYGLTTGSAGGLAKPLRGIFRYRL